MFFPDFRSYFRVEQLNQKNRYGIPENTNGGQLTKKEDGLIKIIVCCAMGRWNQANIYLCFARLPERRGIKSSLGTF